MAKAKRTAGRVITGAVVTAGVALASTSVATADPLSDVQSMISDFQKNPEKFGQDAAKRLENLLGQSGVFSRSAGTEQGTTAVDVNWADLRDLLGNGRNLPADFPEVSQIEMPTELADTLQRSTPQLMALAADQDSGLELFSTKSADGSMDQIIDLVKGLMEGDNFDFADFLQDLLNGVNPPEGEDGGTQPPMVPDNIDLGAITDGLGPIISKVINMVTTAVNGGELTSADFQELMEMVTGLLTEAGVDLGNGDDDEGEGGGEPNYLDWTVTLTDPDGEETKEMPVRELMEALGVEVEEPEDDGGTGDGGDGGEEVTVDPKVSVDPSSIDAGKNTTVTVSVSGFTPDTDVKVAFIKDGEVQEHGGTDTAQVREDGTAEFEFSGTGSLSAGTYDVVVTGEGEESAEATLTVNGDTNNNNNIDNGSGAGTTNNTDDGGQGVSGVNEQASNEGGIGGDGGAGQPQEQNPNAQAEDDIPPPTYNDAAADSLPVTGASSATPWMAGIAGLAVLSGLALLFGSRWRVSKGV